MARRIGHQARKAGALQASDECGELRRLVGALHTGPAAAGVALDEEVDLDAAEPGRDGARESPTTPTLIAPGECREPLDLRRADERKADQDVVEPRVRHHLRLAELLAGDAARARVDLQACELAVLCVLMCGRSAKPCSSQ